MEIQTQNEFICAAFVYVFARPSECGYFIFFCRVICTHFADGHVMYRGRPKRMPSKCDIQRERPDALMILFTPNKHLARVMHIVICT